MLVVMYQDHCFVVTKQSEDFGRSALKRAGHNLLSTRIVDYKGATNV